MLAVNMSPGLLVSVPTASVITTVRTVPDGMRTISGGGPGAGLGAGAGAGAGAAPVFALGAGSVLGGSAGVEGCAAGWSGVEAAGSSARLQAVKALKAPNNNKSTAIIQKRGENFIAFSL
jgi:hypothetical protein